MTTQKDHERLVKVIGKDAHAVHRNPERTVRSARSGGGNAGKRAAWAVGKKLVTGDSQKQASLQFTFDQPGAHLVQFNLNPASPDPGSTTIPPCRVEAIITWETNGNTVLRRVSVTDGCTVQGTGESIKVVAYDVTPGSINVGKEYSVSISVGPGTRGSFTNPPILSSGLIHNVNGNSSLNFIVPDDAGISSVFVSVASASGVPLPEQMVQVQQRTDTGGPGQIIAAYDPRSVVFAPLLPGCRIVAVANRGALDTLNVQAIWGIDG